LKGALYHWLGDDRVTSLEIASQVAIDARIAHESLGPALS
jgi:hypothetical protein